MLSSKSLRKIAAILLTFLFLEMIWNSTYFQVIEAGGGLQVGDWIKYNVKITPVIGKEVTPTWIKLLFTSIEGTNMTVQTTIHLSDGGEMNQTMAVDVVSGSDTGLIIPSNSRIGDSVYISGCGNISIEAESTRTYTGIDRAAVFANHSNSTASFTFFWDKQTGIMLEQNITQSESTTFLKVVDTNIWQTKLNSYPPYQDLLILAIISAVTLTAVILLKTRRKRPRRRTHRIVRSK